MVPTLWSSDAMRSDATAISLAPFFESVLAALASCDFEPYKINLLSNDISVSTQEITLESTGNVPGTFDIQSKPGVGTTTTATYVKSHVDMTPLGDINSTVEILIRCNPDIDFVFTHSTDLGSFTLDTRELREVLGDVSLDTPDVLEWIHAYLEEQTQIIFGGAEKS